MDGVGHSDRPALVRLVGEMRRDPAGPFKTANRARAMGMTPSGFIRQFKRLTGLSPLRFRAALRIAVAKTRLATTCMPVTEICFELGYSSLGTFVRTFTSMVGMCPTRFRDLAMSHPSGDVGDLREAERIAPTEDVDCTAVSGVVASIDTTVPLIVAIGLFREGVPAGRPIDGCLRLGAGEYRLRWPRAERRANLLVAAFPVETVAGGMWAPQPAELWVFSRELRRGLRQGIDGLTLEVRLRRVRETDPPILIPFPMMMSVVRAKTFPGLQPEGGNPGEGRKMQPVI